MSIQEARERCDCASKDRSALAFSSTKTHEMNANRAIPWRPSDAGRMFAPRRMRSVPTASRSSRDRRTPVDAERGEALTASIAVQLALAHAAPRASAHCRCFGGRAFRASLPAAAVGVRRRRASAAPPRQDVRPAEGVCGRELSAIALGQSSLRKLAVGNRSESGSGYVRERAGVRN